MHYLKEEKTSCFQRERKTYKEKGTSERVFIDSKSNLLHWSFPVFFWLLLRQRKKYDARRELFYLTPSAKLPADTLCPGAIFLFSNDLHSTSLGEEQIAECPSHKMGRESVLLPRSPFFSAPAGVGMARERAGHAHPTVIRGSSL